MVEECEETIYDNAANLKVSLRRRGKVNTIVKNDGVSWFSCSGRNGKG